MRIHCPQCTNVLFARIAIRSEGPAVVEVDTRCPHCKNPVKLKIESEVVAHVSLNGVRVVADSTQQSTDSDAPRIL